MENFVTLKVNVKLKKPLRFVKESGVTYLITLGKNLMLENVSPVKINRTIKEFFKFIISIFNFILIF